MRLGGAAATAALLATVMMPTANGAKKPLGPKKPSQYEEITWSYQTNVIGRVIAGSRTLIPLGSFDSGRPELGTVTVACAGKRKVQPCTAQSSVKGKLRLTKFSTVGTKEVDKSSPKLAGAGKQTPRNGAAAQTARGKKKGGGGGGNTGSSAPGSSAPPSSNRVPGGSNPPSTLAPPDDDDDWNYGFCIGEFCVTIWGDSPFMADPLGGGNTTDGQGPRLTPKL